MGEKWCAAALSLVVGCYSGLDPSAGADDETDGADTSGEGTGDTGEGETGENVDPAGCDELAPPFAALRRMSRTNYVNALEDVFGVEAVDQVRFAVDSLPSTKAGVFASELPPPTYSEVASYVDVATQLSFYLTQNDADLAALRPCLPDVGPGADPANETCVAEFIEEYATKLLRRPLAEEDRQRLYGDYEVGGAESVNEGVSTVLTSMLLDPRFLYHVEIDGEEVEPGIVELTPHEIAARLARVLWDSVPDEELLAAADAGLDADALAEQVDRMLADDRARGAMARFYYDWLKLETLPFLSEDLYPDAEARDALRADMEAELLAFVENVTFEREGTYADLLLDRTAFVSTPELGDLYGVGEGEAQLPAGDRAGVLTRAGWLATIEIRGTDAGHLIKRGAKLSEFICRELPLPDPDNFPQVDPTDPASNPNTTIRERFQAVTAEAQCASCHVQLDAYGGPFGHYSAAGAWVDEEQVEDEQGNATQLPIDATATIKLDGEDIDVTDALTLSEALAASPEAAECLAEQLTRNIVARALDDNDHCLAASGATALAPEEGEPGSIREALVRIVRSPHFTKVSIP